MTPRITAIDPSYTRTGVATAQGTRSYSPPPDLPTWRKRAWLRGQLAPLLRASDIVGIEGLYPATQRGWLDRAYLVGTLIDAALSAGHAGVILIAPASVKIYATGNGQAPKAAMLLALEVHAPDHDGAWNVANADEADAWWICALAHDLLGQPLIHLPPTHRRALDAYRGPFTTKRANPWVRAYDPTTARRTLGG